MTYRILPSVPQLELESVVNTPMLCDPTPTQEAERATPLDIDKAIADVPPFTMTIDLDDRQGRLVIESGLDDTRIGKGTTLRDPVAVMKVILAAHDTLAALELRDLVGMGFKPKKPRKQRSSMQKNAPGTRIISAKSTLVSPKSLSTER